MYEDDEKLAETLAGPGISKPYIGPGDEKEDPGLLLCGPIGLGRYARHALG